MYGNAWMSRQKSAAGVKPSWRASARAMQKGNMGLEPPHTVPTGALPSGAVRRRPPSSRPQKGRPINSLHQEPGKATGTQCQLGKAAARAVPCRVLQSHRDRAAQGCGSPPLASPCPGYET
uniref:Uncharacterized protein n=1 Tax=Macaca mulatta TaxID=9544 RepID=A0A5F8AMW7_MACMU